jgi:hypothetical protein
MGSGFFSRSYDGSNADHGCEDGATMLGMFQ